MTFFQKIIFLFFLYLVFNFSFCERLQAFALGGSQESKISLVEDSLSSNDYELALIRYVDCHKLYREGLYNRAIHNLNKMTAVLEAQNNPNFLSKFYNLLGLCYWSEGSQIKALKFYLKAQENIERAEGGPRERIMILINIGNVYLSNSKFEKAFGNYLKAKELSKQIREDFTYSIALGNIATVYSAKFNPKKNIEKALDYFNRAKVLRKSIGDVDGEADVLESESELAMLSNDYDLAISRLSYASHLYDSLGLEVKKAFVSIKLATLYLTLNNIKEARACLSYAKTVYSREPILDLNLAILELETKLFSKAKKFKKAYTAVVKLSSLKDSVREMASIKDVDDLLHTYELNDAISKERVKLKEIKANQEIEINTKNATISQRNYLIFIFIFLFVIAVTFLTFLWLYTKRLNRLNVQIENQKEELRWKAKQLSVANKKIASNNYYLEKEVKNTMVKLKQSTKEMEHFLYKTSHDFRRPIATLQGIFNISKFDNSPEYLSDMLKKVDETANHMDRMLGKLLMIGELQFSKQQKKKLDFKAIMKSIKSRYFPHLDKYEIDFKYKLTNLPTILSYPKAYEMIIRHLVSNSIVYRSRLNPYIKVEICFSDKDQKLDIQVTDNGEGIKFEYHEKIFEMYYRGNERSKGSGLGLYILRKAVDKLRGEIKLLSEEKSGSLFVISIPINVEDYDKDSERVNAEYRLNDLIYS